MVQVSVQSQALLRQSRRNSIKREIRFLLKKYALTDSKPSALRRIVIEYRHVQVSTIARR